MSYRIYSPDGHTIEHGTSYRSLKAARAALSAWCKRYEAQGYYRDNRWRQIPLADLPDECIIDKTP